MRTTAFLVVALLASSAGGSVSAQSAERQLRSVIAEAGSTPSVEGLMAATSAALTLRDFELADSLQQAGGALMQNMIQGGMFLLVQQALVSGKGVDGALRALRDIREFLHVPPTAIATLANNYPALLTGGGLDDLILGLSVDATQPENRCVCYAAKAWVHRMAGRHEVARVYWDSLVASRGGLSELPAGLSPDQRADVGGQYARDLARAGRTTEARAMLVEAMRLEVSEQARPVVMRRWAQAHAELGEAEPATEILEQLLNMPSPVTVHSLAARPTWNPIRDTPSFQALLARHR